MQQLVADATGRARMGVEIAVVGDVVATAVARVTPMLAAPIELHVASPSARVACPRDELEHLVVGMLLEAAAAKRLALLVRERTIDDACWLELVRATEVLDPDIHELRIVDAIATRAGGEVSRSEVHAGEELVVALPCMRPADPG